MILVWPCREFINMISKCSLLCSVVEEILDSWNDCMDEWYIKKWKLRTEGQIHHEWCG